MASSKLNLDAIFAPLLWSGTRYYLLVSSLLAVIGFGAYAYYVQLTTGLGVTGMRSVVSWGFYIINFVFMIGISHAGTLISAILRVANADWRKPITRMAESITVMAILVAAFLPLLDLGRPDRIANVFLFARLQSPLTWDFISIGTYLIGSIIYLYLPLIPDLAACRDSLQGASGLRRWLYTKLSLGWTGTEEQEHRLKRAIKVMAIIIIPVAVSVHSVVSWDFAMTLRVEWHNALFAPYFVTGAIFSGIATIMLVMAAFRRAYHLEQFIQLKHFLYLGYIMLVVDVAMIYFTISEFLVAGYGGEVLDTTYLFLLLWGPYAPLFWFQIVGGLIVPAAIVAVPRMRKIKWLVVAALLVDMGMWAERFLIIVPAMATPQLPYQLGTYWPTWVEVSIVSATLSAFALLLVVFGKVFPVVSLWEVAERETSLGQEGSHEAEAHILPVPSAPSLPSSTRRSFVRTSALSVVGFALGWAAYTYALKAAPHTAEARGTSSGAIGIPLSNLGEVTSLEAARSKATFPVSAPKWLPDDASLQEVRISGDGRLVALLYASLRLQPLPIYGERIALAIIQSEDVDGGPPAYLPRDNIVNLDGQAYLAREPASSVSGEPGRLQWWTKRTRHTILSPLPSSEMIKVARSMEVL